MVLMLDGWMARERGPDWGAGPRKKEPQRILWHEAVSYTHLTLPTSDLV